MLVGCLVVLPLLPTGTLPVSVQLVIVYAVVVLSTVASRFFTPARFTVVADIVPAADQSRASGITQATSATAAIIGPPLAAPLCGERTPRSTLPEKNSVHSPTDASHPRISAFASALLIASRV